MNEQDYSVNLLKFFGINNPLMPTKNVLKLQRNHGELSLSIYETVEGDFDLHFSNQDLHVKNQDKIMKFNKEYPVITFVTENEFESFIITIEDELDIEIKDSQIFAEQVLPIENENMKNDHEMFVLFLY